MERNVQRPKTNGVTDIALLFFLYWGLSRDHGDDECEGWDDGNENGTVKHMHAVNICMLGASVAATHTMTDH
jgi:hypothetical protein